jgi:hypothetical protein
MVTPPPKSLFVVEISSKGGFALNVDSEKPSIKFITKNSLVTLLYIFTEY